MQFNALSTALLLSILISCLLLYSTLKRKEANAGIELFFVLLSITVWSFFAFLEAITQPIHYKILFSVLSYIGITLLPVFLLIFSCRYVHLSGWLNRKNISMLFIIPLATLAIAATNGLHGFLWAEISLSQNTLAGVFANYSHGYWFWAHTAYSYSLIIASLLILFFGMLRFKHTYRSYSRMFIVLATLPLLANIIYIFSPQIIEGMDITPVMFTVSGALLFFALYYTKFLNLSPVAWETIIESLDNGVLLVNKEDLAVDFNRKFIKFFDIKASEIGTHIKALLKDNPKILEFICQTEAKEKEVRYIKNGKEFFLQLECTPVFDKKKKIARILLIRDVTQKKIDQQKMKFNEKKFRSLFEYSMDGIYIADPEGKYIDVNSSLAAMLGYESREKLLQTSTESIYFPGFSLENREGIFEARIKKKNGDAIEAEISVKCIYEDTRPKYFQGIVRDITLRKKTENQLKFLSFHDSLTGLYNRYYFEEELKRINRGTKRFFPVSIISMDLNNLKKINDNSGHLQGDYILKETARLLSSVIRRADILARVGGDEFCAILPNTPKEVAEQRKEKLEEGIRKYNQANEMSINIAIGISSTFENENSIHDAIKRADDQMYAHKRKMKSEAGPGPQLF